MSVESVTQAVSGLALAFSDQEDDTYAMSRPFGVALLFAGVDETGPHLYHLDPSGTFIEYDAKAIGSGSEGAQQNLQDVYHKVFFFVFELFKYLLIFVNGLIHFCLRL